MSTVVTEIEFRTAVRDGLAEELERDPRVIFFGEDVAKPGGVFAVTRDLWERFPEQVFDTPISELAITGAAFGAAVMGKRPVIEIMFGDFLGLSLDSLVNQAAKYWYLSQGTTPVPMVVRSAVGAGGRFGAIHSQMPITWFLGVPGIKIACPATPADAKGMLKAAIRDDNPVLFFEHKKLYGLKGPVGSGIIPLGKASVVRPGRDLTIVSAMKGVHDSLEAAVRLAGHGIDAEVIDLRCLKPLDRDTILGSLRRTNRLLVVEEGPRTGGWAGEVMALLLEDGLDDLDDAWRLCTPDHPIPYSPPLEDAFLPGVDAIVRSVLGRLPFSRGA
jgi:acetoin:2,6-dichlorophenolindophenol oxidoreductase subunit beta